MAVFGYLKKEKTDHDHNKGNISTWSLMTQILRDGLQSYGGDSNLEK